MKNIGILGAGMAGCGAAYLLRSQNVDTVMFEKQSYFGGHTASFSFDTGFIFDDGPHISFTKDPRIQKLFAENVNYEYETLQAKVNNYWKGYWIKHPAQCNLYGLPSDLVVDIIEDFINARQNGKPRIQNYADWLNAAFGRKFAETFPMEYGHKYHTTTADTMSTDWLGPRMYRPELREVLLGAITPSTPDVHYVDHFRYPTYNGFISYVAPFMKYTDLHLEHEAVSIDHGNREIKFSNGVEYTYDRLISSLPLPALISVLKDVPEDVIEASQKLAWTICVMVNIGIGREDLSDATWSYFYDKDVVFTRLSFPHNMSPHNVPPGCSSVQAELYFSKKYRPLDREPDEFIEPVIRDLIKVGLLREDDEIKHKNAALVPYANIIFDLERTDALQTVHGFLDDIGIAYCGRYGEWGYHWTDEAFKSGENAAEKLLLEKA